MKKNKGKILLGLFLVGATVLMHIGHYIIFQDMHHLMIYLVGDIAFVPLEVFLVSLVFERIVEIQDATEKKKKVYMLIEVFYIELGNELLLEFSNTDKEVKSYVSQLQPNMQWDADEFKCLKTVINKLQKLVDIEEINLVGLYENMKANKPMLINMISNPALTESSSFSDTIISTFHLLDELDSRDLSNLTKEDLMHLKVDIERTYKGLADDWVNYMQHLSKEYPFLYYTAIQKNPFVEA